MMELIGAVYTLLAVVTLAGVALILIAVLALISLALLASSTSPEPDRGEVADLDYQPAALRWNGSPGTGGRRSRLSALRRRRVASSPAVGKGTAESTSLPVASAPSPERARAASAEPAPLARVPAMASKAGQRPARGPGWSVKLLAMSFKARHALVAARESAAFAMVSATAAKARQGTAAAWTRGVAAVRERSANLSGFLPHEYGEIARKLVGRKTHPIFGGRHADQAPVPRRPRRQPAASPRAARGPRALRGRSPARRAAS